MQSRRCGWHSRARWRPGSTTGAAPRKEHGPWTKRFCARRQRGFVHPRCAFMPGRPACLSLGQGAVLAAKWIGKPVSRELHRRPRPTGGRPFCIPNELTYSVTAPEEEPRVQGGIVESYRRLSEGLLKGLRLLAVPGVECTSQRHRRRRRTQTARSLSSALPL